MEHDDQPVGAGDADVQRDEQTRLLLRQVEPENIRWSGGRCEIALGKAWPEMFASLPELGEVLVVTGNSAAILGMTSRFPVVEFCEGYCHARGWNGALAYELVPWEHATAVTRRQPKGATPHFLEFRDGADLVIHKICLTAQSDFSKFVEWVQMHQAGSGTDSALSVDFPPARWRTRPQRHWLDYESVDSVDPEMLVPLFEAASRREIEMIARVTNDGAIQSATFIPRQRTPVQDWWFVSDDRTALHFDPAGLGEAVIHYAPNEGETEPVLSLQCFDDWGNLCLTLGASNVDSRTQWNQLLADTAKLK